MTEFMDDGNYKARIRGKWGFSEIDNANQTQFFWADVDVYAFETGGGVYEPLDEPVSKQITQWVTPKTKDQVKKLVKSLELQDLSEMDPDSPNSVDLFEKEITVSQKVEEYPKGSGKVREKWSFRPSVVKAMSAEKKTALFETYRLD